MKELWSTIIGSHMWGMATPSSDMDIFGCEIAPTKDVLLGRRFRPVKTEMPKDRIDMMCFEVGHVVDMLVKGNVNFVWGLTSPQVASTSDAHTELLGIYNRQIAKNIYHSIDGLFRHNYRDYIEKAKEPKPKRIWMMYRTLQFGMKILDEGIVEYKPVATEISVPMLDAAYDSLQCAYDASDLPEEPDPEPYMDFLYRLRILELCDTI